MYEQLYFHSGYTKNTLVFDSTSAPSSRRISATSTWPYKAAKCNGVKPLYWGIIKEILNSLCANYKFNQGECMKSLKPGSH